MGILGYIVEIFPGHIMFAGLTYNKKGVFYKERKNKTATCTPISIALSIGGRTGMRAP